MSTGNLILIDNGISCVIPGPYRNKYGEHFHRDAKAWSDFQIDKNGGGEAQLTKLNQLFLDFKLANHIIATRTNPENKEKLYMRSAL